METPFRITTPLRLVLDVFMHDVDRARYGLDIARETGLKPGSLYPILARLEHAGWLTSHWEDLQESEAGRPRRRYYALTREGALGARVVQARTSAELARSLRLRWQQP